MSVVERDNSRHYTWGAACDGWHLLEHAALSVIEERVPPGASEQRHRHAQSRQFFYALSGEATLEVDGQIHRLCAAQGLHVPPGAAHRLYNEGEVDARFLVISAPPSHGDREAAP
ncbi:MAG TPA: cupin domain-containing protein [Arenimonas sp.]|uniref:cupin domain-containing protein n=1 Tax=Arenimonas sp. TaxID=1872635 RepID=UPI002D0B8B1C|nr:cupin domain-containing protein [Arenimonas sp.]HMB55902.1 cupin domain-containing protein [Arenimonas sp.]